jgi:ATP-dependent Clp protease ATP-binding subunit ClpA
MRVSPEVEIAFGLAASEAERRRHEFMSVEHLLFALLFDSDCARVIQHSGGDVDAIRRKLDRFLDTEVPQMADGAEIAPSPTVGFQRVVQRAAIHVRSAGKDEVRGRNILVAIFAEADSIATHTLQDAGITRFDVVNYISHGVSKAGDPAPEVKGSPASTEEEEDRRPPRASLIPSSADRTRSIAPFRSSPGAARTTRSSSATPA